MNGENPLRLQKYLAEAGVASRRKCEELIKEGRVKVNGLTAVLGSSVEEGDEVLLDGRPVRAEPQKVVYAFNKPKNVI
ncbi:MAG: rRNA pseudouridine synthase, partial [Clostridia bacterium]|nr:rRNA pseudouridine synthase [Clostridia bacterium]